MIVISGCLCGIKCKYNGEDNGNKNIIEMARKYGFIPICPEQLGGLSTPREPSEIVVGNAKDVLRGNGKILNIKGQDVTEQFVKGAMESLKIANMFGAKVAILKSKSPSCGYGEVYDGSFKGVLKEGNGVTAELFLQNGIEIYTENDIGRIERILFNYYD